MAQTSTITKQPFGKTADGKNVDLYTLTGRKGMEARVMTYGAILVSLKTADRNGAAGDVVLGFETLDGYLKGHPFFGAIAGRYANRIARGKFALGGQTYTLATNNGPNHLHGGLKGFDKQVWKARVVKKTAGPESLELTYLSRDGEEGYPGNLTVTVTYSITDDNGLRIDYTATTDRETVVNVTNHSYFNLAGQGDVLNHELVISADRFTPVDAGLIPTGELREVKGTALDFTIMRKIGERIDADEEQMRLGKGYDHNLVFSNYDGKLNHQVTVWEPTTGRLMEVLTTEPGVQLYTANNLDGKLSGKGRSYTTRSGFCLETQHFPDSPNKPAFPTTTLKPGAVFKSTTVFRFGVR
ncbi:MAG: aldose epimerase family protein [Blastocatellia bacterium]